MLPEIFRDEVMRIESRRLWLRWPVAGDAPAIEAFARLAEVATMTATWPHPLPEGEVVRRIAAIRRSNVSGAGITFALTLKGQPGRAIGLIGGRQEEDGGSIGIGYMLSPDVAGRGLMSEAVAALSGLLISFRATAAISASVRTGNPASGRVLEKAGFVLERTEPVDMPARGPGIPVHRYRLVRRQLAAA